MGERAPGRAYDRFTVEIIDPRSFAALQRAQVAAKTVPCADPAVADAMFSDSHRVQARAAAACADCPIQPECLTFGIRNREYWGVFGGLTEWQRNGRKTRGRPKKSA